MQKQKPLIVRLPMYFFVLFVLFAAINFFVVGDTDLSTPGVAETPMTTWLFVAILFFCLSLVFFGINFIQWKKVFSAAGLFGISMIMCGLSFSSIIIFGPVLGNDLNEPINLFFGALFALGVIGTMINGLRA